MSDHSGIEWTEPTWNPTVGCTKVSPWCDRCYAERMIRRFPATYPRGFALTLRPDALDLPRRWRRPRAVFVNSMSDLFHAEVPEPFIRSVFEVMAECPRHTFQVLTKRAERAARLAPRLGRNCLEQQASLSAWFSPADFVKELDGSLVLAGQHQTIKADVAAVVHRAPRMADIGISDRAQLLPVKVEQMIGGFLGRRVLALGGFGDGSPAFAKERRPSIGVVPAQCLTQVSFEIAYLKGDTEIDLPFGRQLSKSCEGDVLP